MKCIGWALLILLVVTWSWGQQVGQTRSEVIAELGSPVSKVESPSKAILVFEDGTRVTFRNDRVESIDTVSRPTPTVRKEKAVVTLGGRKISLGIFSWKKLFVSLGAAALFGLLTFRIFFTSFDDYVEAERYSHQPNWISWLRDEYLEDVTATVRLNLWTFLMIAAGVFVYSMLSVFDVFVS